MMQHIHAREIDLDAVQAVLHASANGRKEGREAGLREAEAAARRSAKRARSILLASVVTALLVGFSAGLFLGATSPRAARAMETTIPR